MLLNFSLANSKQKITKFSKNHHRSFYRNMTTKRPKVLVFDLDYTLWPFWVDTHVTPPFRKGSNGKIVDRDGATIKYYPEAPDILQDLYNRGYVLAVASRTGEIEGAKQLLQLLDWDKYFKQKEIYPGSKTTHLTKIKQRNNVEFNEIIFFDDEDRNIRDTSKLGVFAVFVKNGVNKRLIEDSLKRYEEHNK